MPNNAPLQQSLVEQDLREYLKFAGPGKESDFLIPEAAAWIVRIDRQRLAVEAALDDLRSQVIAKALELRRAE